MLDDENLRRMLCRLNIEYEERPVNDGHFIEWWSGHILISFKFSHGGTIESISGDEQA
jgi:hypothetical protein